MEWRTFLPKRISRASAIFWIGLFIIVIFFFWSSHITSLVEVGSENIMYAFAPSTQRAFDYGERHFDATDASLYNLNRAEYFFNKVAVVDPTFPYLYHELARISFLRGNYRKAMAQIDLQITIHGDTEPNSYYVRGLIEGYMGTYDAAATDYEHFLQFDPNDWAAINDYAWILLKAARNAEAARVTDAALKNFPDNPWLLNSNATAHYEIGEYTQALVSVKKAVTLSGSLTPDEWLHAYPGNDPSIASEGIASFQKAALDNMHSIEAKLATSTVQ